MTNSPYRILIVDDDKIVRQGLRVLLEQPDEFVVVDETSSARGIAHAIALQSQVILMDPRIPNLDAGLHLLAELRESVQGVRVVALTDPGEKPDLVYRIINWGAVGCVL